MRCYHCNSIIRPQAWIEKVEEEDSQGQPIVRIYHHDCYANWLPGFKVEALEELFKEALKKSDPKESIAFLKKTPFSGMAKRQRAKLIKELNFANPIILDELTTKLWTHVMDDL